MDSEHKYIHGYNSKEQERLIYQNSFLSQFIYKRIDLSGINALLEVGCGVGAQMQYVFNQYSEINITGVDISKAQIEQARINLASHGIAADKYELIVADVMDGLVLDNPCDGLMLVWVLEHVADPLSLLRNATKNLKPHSNVFITEVFDSSFYIYPPCPKMQEFWENSKLLKTRISGDADVGVRLFDVLDNAGLKNIKVEPFIVHLDRSDLALKNQMFDYWESLLESGLTELIENNLSSPSNWKEIQSEIAYLKSRSDSVFYYSFVQAFAHT